jgi:DNA repair ATPase RecN
VKPHPIATTMIRWLISLGYHQNNQDIEELYQQLLNQGNLAELPTEENLFVARLRQQEGARNRHANEELHAFADQAFQEIFEEIQNAFVPVHARIEQDGQELIQEVGRRGQIDHELLEVILNRMHELDREAQQFHARVDRLHGGIAQVNREIAHVNNQNAELSHALAEARKAVQEREHGWLKALLTTVAIIGVSTIGSVILQSMVAKGMGISVTPLKGGGPGGMLNLNWKV